jgi:hypothetical protein
MFQGEIPDEMTQLALADAIPTLVEYVSTHAWEGGIEYRKGSDRITLVSPSLQPEGGKITTSTYRVLALTIQHKQAA